MSYPYFITAYSDQCGICEDNVAKYAAENLPENVTGLYYDSELIYKIYTGSPETIGWNTEFNVQASHNGEMDSFGNIGNVTSCTQTTTTTTTPAPPPADVMEWGLALNSVTGPVCSSSPTYVAYTVTGTTELNVALFYENTGLTSVFSPGEDIIGFSTGWTYITHFGNIDVSGNISGNTVCSAYPTTTTTTTAAPESPIGFTIQPNTTDLYYTRSPIVYRYSGLTIAENYQYYFYLHVGSGDTVNTGTTIYAKIDRKPDTHSGITVDVSNLLRTYMKNNLTYTDYNICYFWGNLLEYSGITKTAEKISNVSKAVLGYSEYDSSGTFNKTFSGDYLMNTISSSVPYNIPNYLPLSTNYYYNLYWRYTGSQVTSATLVYSTTGGTITSNYTFDTGYTIATIPLVQLGSIYTTTKLTVTFYNCLTAVTSYTFNYDTCNGNDLTYVSFLNKWGMWDKFYFRGRSDTQLDVTNDNYKFNNVNYKNMTYNPREGSYHMFNKQGKERIILNTGWINEDKNAQIKEMLLSEYIQIDNLPYIVIDKSVKYKTNKWDKLINYTLIFEKAFDSINNII